MKLLKLILLYLFLITPTQADTIYELIKIPNLEIYNLKTENKLRYLNAKQAFTIGVDNNINCFKSSKQDLDKKYKIIEKNPGGRLCASFSPLLQRRNPSLMNLQSPWFWKPGWI